MTRFDNAFEVDGISIGDVGIFAAISGEPNLGDDGSIPDGSIILRPGAAPVIKEDQQGGVFLDTPRWQFRFDGAIEAVSSDYLATVDNRESLFFLAPVPGVITGVFCQAKEIKNDPVDVTLFVAGSIKTTGTITLAVSSTSTYGSSLGLSIGVDAGDTIKIRLSPESGKARSMITTVLFAQRIM